MRAQVTTCILALMLAAGPVEAQRDFGDWEPTSTRAAETILLVFDPSTGSYRSMTLAALLADLGLTFPDALTRYVFQIPWPGSTPTSLTAAQIQGGTRADSGDLSILVPPPPAMGNVSIGFAVPATVAADTTYASTGASNSGFNFIGSYVKLPDVTLDVDGTSVVYAVWVRSSELLPVPANTRYIFLSPTVQP